MCLTLLEQFDRALEPRDMHSACALLERVCATPLGDDALDDAGERATFEPLLFSARALQLCERVLAAPAATAYAPLREWCARLVRHFCRQAKANPVIFVHAVIPPPERCARWCEEISHSYSNFGPGGGGGGVADLSLIHI